MPPIRGHGNASLFVGQFTMETLLNKEKNLLLQQPNF